MLTYGIVNFRQHGKFYKNHLRCASGRAGWREKRNEAMSAKLKHVLKLHVLWAQSVEETAIAVAKQENTLRPLKCSPPNALMFRGKRGESAENLMQPPPRSREGNRDTRSAKQSSWTALHLHTGCQQMWVVWGVRVVPNGERGNDRKVSHVRAWGALVRRYFHAQPFGGSQRWWWWHASLPGSHLAPQALNKASCRGGSTCGGGRQGQEIKTSYQLSQQHSANRGLGNTCCHLCAARLVTLASHMWTPFEALWSW